MEGGGQSRCGGAARRGRALRWLPVLALALAGCAPGARSPGDPTPGRVRTEPAAAPAGARTRALSGEDLRWLNRVTFGIDRGSADRYRQLGRAGFLEEQLAPSPSDPPELAAAIATLPVTRKSAEALVLDARAEDRRIDALATEAEKRQARSAQHRAALQAVRETAQRHLMRALHSPAQLREQMTWFWMNHFSVFSGKGSVAWTVAEYEETAVRPRALGRFCNLVLATALSPAMLEYLDAAHSAAGQLNENYARELMELHTLGVSGGPSGAPYSQRDVQELARALTGLGMSTTYPPRLPRNLEPHYVRSGLFEFHPGRHDFGSKTLLGHSIAGEGLPETAQAVTVLCRQRATARFISAKMAAYFLTDNPPPGLVENMAATFERTGGDIAAVLRAMFLSPAFSDHLRLAEGGTKLKDPMQFVVSSLRLAYEGTAIRDYRAPLAWLARLGEPLYGRVTPDGYPLAERAWASSGQMVARFEIARAIGAGQAELRGPGDPSGPPALRGNELVQEAMAPALGARTRQALARTASDGEWNMVFLAAPEWMQR